MLKRKCYSKTQFMVNSFSKVLLIRNCVNEERRIERKQQCFKKVGDIKEKLNLEILESAISKIILCKDFLNLHF